MVAKIAKLTLSSLAIVMVAGLGLGLAVLQAKGGKLLSVQSGSMEPAISKGDLVVATRIPAQLLQRGDVVTFTNPEQPGTTITHRIVETPNAENQQRFITKGDANPAADQPISSRTIVGKAAFTVPLAGYAIDFIRKPLGLLLLIYIPALGVVWRELKRLIKHYKDQEPYVAAGAAKRLNGPADSTGQQVTFGLKIVTFLIVLSLGAALPVRAALMSTAVLGSNTISTTSGIPGGEVIAICKFPGNESLLSYALEDAMFPEQPDAPLTLDAPLPAGTYRITAKSIDTHTARPNSPTQPNERWFAQLYGADQSTPLTQTGVTQDIPDDIDEVTSTLNESLTIAEPLTAVRFVHEAYLSGLEQANFGGRRFDELSAEEKRQVIWNSVHPGCLEFTPLQLNIQPAEPR